MANSTTTNPIIIDTFSANVVISTTPKLITHGKLSGGNAADKVVLKDKNSNIIARFSIDTNSGHDDLNLPAGSPIFADGIQIVSADCTYAGSPTLLLYMKS